MILLTGPTGNTGRDVLSRLRESGRPLRAMVRRPEARRDLEAEGVDVVEGDFDRPDSLRAALEGVERAFLVCTPDEKLAEREIAFVDAAVEAGVERLVKISAITASAESESPNLRQHAAVEKHIRESGLEHTLLRPNGFMQTLVWMSLPMIQAQGVLAGPAGDGRCAHVDLRDVGEAAFRALVDDSPRAGAFDLTGPRAVTMAEIAGWISEAFDRPVQYVDLPPEQMAGGMRQMGVAESSVQHVLAVFRAIREGEFDLVTDSFERFGVQPRDWPTCVADLAAGRTSAATSFDSPPGGPGGPGGPPPAGA